MDGIVDVVEALRLLFTAWIIKLIVSTPGLRSDGGGVLFNAELMDSLKERLLCA